MGKTWRHKKERGRKGKPHTQRPRGIGDIPSIKSQRALRQEIEIQKARLTQSQQREA